MTADGRTADVAAAREAVIDAGQAWVETWIMACGPIQRVCDPKPAVAALHTALDRYALAAVAALPCYCDWYNDLNHPCNHEYWGEDLCPSCSARTQLRETAATEA